MELLPSQQGELEISSISWFGDEKEKCSLPNSPNVHENSKATVDFHILKQLLDRFELAEKELRRLITEISFPKNINEFEKFIFSEIINPETTNEQIIEMRKLYHELKKSDQDHSKILENICDSDVLEFSTTKSSSTQHEKQSDANDNTRINNPENKSCVKKKKSEKLKIKNSSNIRNPSNTRKRNSKKNFLPGIIKIYPRKKGCYETEKFDSNENILHHSPSSSVFHCELMTANNNVLSFSSPNLQVTTSTIEPQPFMNIDFSSENNYFIDTNQQDYVQQFFFSDNSTINISHHEDTLLYYNPVNV
ncbi:4650_t:CDS:1 [Dentiscutata heterogama]|uniref:4650_t:CDS:1 n=1 Tax=Dentiscutata heterogama TaxID=1316150 RepID=A0ACA9LBT0_9GLOM|nr:4650_t:CDS:1 [Dentiscutata heterogama]